MSDELKPCPFCGGPVELERATGAFELAHGRTREWWGVICRNTENLGGTCALSISPSASKEAAVKRWNMRVPLETLQRERDEAVRDAERYRWLKAWDKLDGWTDEAIDREIAIDAAIKSGSEG